MFFMFFLTYLESCGAIVGSCLMGLTRERLEGGGVNSSLPPTFEEE